MLLSDEVRELQKKYCDGETLLESIETVNKHARKDGLTIIKTRDEDSGEAYYMLSNTTKTADDCWEDLTLRNGGMEWDEREKKILKKIATKILREKKKKVSSSDILDFFDVESTMERDALEGDIQRLVKFKWLNTNNEMEVTLGPRFLGQMRKWIPLQTDIVYCQCHLLVLRGHFCKCRKTGFHFKCLKNEDLNLGCKHCKKESKNLGEKRKGGEHEEKRNKKKTRKQENCADRVGLTNLGNTCYMNSVLQCFSKMTVLTNTLLHSSDGNPILKAYVDLLLGLSNPGNVSALTPVEFLKCFTSEKASFKNNNQHDAQEFLQALQEELHEGAKLSNLENKNVVRETFEGKLKASVSCFKCKKVKSSLEPFSELSLGFPDKPNSVMSLENLLDHYLQPEMLRKDNKYQCRVCKTKTKAVKFLKVDETSPILCLHLKRFNNQGKKISKKVTFPVSGLEVGNSTYSLISVICHHGTSIRHGHYSAYCLSQSKETQTWYHYDDDNVTKVSVDQVQGVQPYILFYERD